MPSTALDRLNVMLLAKPVPTSASDVEFAPARTDAGVIDVIVGGELTSQALARVEVPLPSVTVKLAADYDQWR